MLWLWKMRNPIKILNSIAFQEKNCNNYNNVFNFLASKAVELSQKARRPPLRIEKEVEQLVAEVDRCCRKGLKWVKI